MSNSSVNSQQGNPFTQPTLSQLHIPSIQHVVLFGGGQLLVDLAKTTQTLGLKATIFAVNRHLHEQINDLGETLEEVCTQAGIPCYATADVNTDERFLALASPSTIGIGLGEAYTFTPETLNQFHHQLLDLIIIRLPQYLGGAHFTWQILRNHRLGAWHFQQINAEMKPGYVNNGPLLMSHEFVLPTAARIPADFFEAYHQEALTFYTRFLQQAKSGHTFPLTHLQNEFSTYFPRLHTKTQAWIDWSWRAEELERFICAFDDPYPGCSTTLNGSSNGERVFLKGVQQDPSEGRFHPFMTGLVYRKTENALFVAVKDGGLIVQKVLNEAGENILPSIQLGQRFFTPTQQLEQAMTFHAEYTTEGLATAVS